MSETLGFFGPPRPNAILSGKTGRTTEESDPVERKVEITLPCKEPATANIPPGGTGRKHGMLSRGRRL